MPDSLDTRLAPEGSPMATTIFLLLNGLGVAFLLNVLANFWKEGQRPKTNARKYAAEFGREWTEVVIQMHPISHSAPGGSSVIPFQARDTEPAGKPDHGPAAREAIEIPLRRVSIR